MDAIYLVAICGAGLLLVALLLIGVLIWLFSGSVKSGKASYNDVY